MVHICTGILQKAPLNLTELPTYNWPIKAAIISNQKIIRIPYLNRYTTLVRVRLQEKMHFIE